MRPILSLNRTHCGMWLNVREHQMAQPSSISRRISDCITHLQENNHEGALVSLFPAIDKTAKKRHPALNVGARIRAFLDEEELLLHSLVLGRPVRSKIISNNHSVASAIYLFGRTSILHEGELDPRLKFTRENFIEMGDSKWHFPVSYIAAMSVAVISAPENAGESIEGSLRITIAGNEFRINELWGKKSEIELLVFNEQ